MKIQLRFLMTALAAAVFAAGSAAAVASGSDGDSSYCMDVDLGPFHMVPGFVTPEGACAVQEYWDGWLQETYYPFTIEDHQFNCEVAGDLMKLPSGDMAPTSVVSDGEIEGTIGGHPFRGTLLCASLTNYYAHFCPDPPNAPCFQLAQPFLQPEIPYYMQVTEVSVLDGVVTVAKGEGKGKLVEVPVLMATRAAGIMHLEDLSEDNTQVGAAVTHSLLGLVTYEEEDGEIDAKKLDGSLDVLLQGHIFHPDPVSSDPKAARVRGAICSKGLYKRLNGKGKMGRDDD